MNWLDGIIGFISPEWGARREAWRQSLTEMRNYDAGNYDRGNANWRVLNQSAEFTDRYSRDNVRARARDLERNSDMMNSVIGAYKRNVIGGGYALQAKTGSDKTNEIIQTAWKKWCKKQNCDVTGTQSFTQMMRMCVKRKKVDGGILIIKRYTKDGYLPFKLQTFEVDELDNSQMLPKKKGNKVVGGIEMNEYNKPMGYWIRQYSVDGMALSNPVYVDAKDVIFLYTKHRPSQVREMSDMSPTITRIRDANEFMIAVSVKERIAACLSVFIKKQLPTTGIGRQNGSVPGPHQDYQGKSIAPGMIKELNAGDEIQVVNPTGQATDAASYIKLQQRLVGAGQGISYEATSRDMSESNYSSTRQGIIEDDMTYAEEKEMLMEVMDEIYETFIISLWLAGELDAKDFWDNKDKYFEHAWITAPKKWIDPQKEANANKIALNTGQKTFKQIAAEQGRDWKEQIDEMAEVLEYAKDKGIDLGGVIFDQTAAELYEDEETPADNPQQTDGNQTGEETGQESEEGDGAEEEGKQTTRELTVNSIRAMEGEGNERKFILSFSSEEPYERWWGTEILDHSDGAVDLTRLNEIGVLLFNHDRNRVIGKVNRAWIEDLRGMAEVEFDSDEDADLIYQKVKSGTLKTTSVGYQIDSWEEVMPNKQSADGRFTGPADIARKWTPYEISIVSVPADPTVGVGRELEEETEQGTQSRSTDWFERQLQINKNIINQGGNRR